MKVLLSLTKTWTIDLDDPKNEDIRCMVSDAAGDEDQNDLDVIHDAVRECLADDPSTIVDLEIDETDFEIKVTA